MLNPNGEVTSAKFIFIDNPIEVKEVTGGYEYVGNAGVQLLATARKRGMDILVEVR